MAIWHIKTGMCESSNKREVHVITGLYQKTRETPSKQSNITSKKKRRRKATQSQQKNKEIVKTREQLNEIGNKRTI